MTVSAVSRSVIVGSVLVPWAAGTYIGLILLPTAALSTTLPEAYEILGPVIPGLLMSGAIAFLALAFAYLGGERKW